MTKIVKYFSRLQKELEILFGAIVMLLYTRFLTFISQTPGDMYHGDCISKLVQRSGEEAEAAILCTLFLEKPYNPESEELIAQS